VNLPSGLSPSVVEFHHINPPLEAEGSRTVTAGSDLHRPRYTRELSTRRQHSTPTGDLERHAEEGFAHPGDQHRCLGIVTIDRH
jgi:hypothetical protein